jgi:lysyl-tRNA synthetase class 2
VRDVLHAHDFVEVETPVLQTVHGGAAARRSSPTSTPSSST